MSDEFSEEPVIGHHVGAEFHQPEPTFENLDEPDERVLITTADVDWSTSNRVSMTKETFEKLIEWYEENNE